jgi:hypothetical protein
MKKSKLLFVNASLTNDTADVRSPSYFLASGIQVAIVQLGSMVRSASLEMARPLTSAGSNAKTVGNVAAERRTTSCLSSLGTSSKSSTKLIVFGSTACAPKASLVSSVSTSWKFAQVESMYACMVPSAFRMRRPKRRRTSIPAIVTKPTIRWSNTLEGFASTQALISVQRRASRALERPTLRSASITENARQRWHKMNSKYGLLISTSMCLKFGGVLTSVSCSFLLNLP